MNSQKDDRSQTHAARLLEAVDRQSVPPDEAFLAQLRERTLPVFLQASQPGTVRPRRYRIMHSKLFKLLVPVAAAAVIILAVGIWPEHDRHNNVTGKVYALGDVPGLYRQATVIHEHRFYHLPHVPAGIRTQKYSWDRWLDMTHERWASYVQHAGSTEGAQPATPSELQTLFDYVCDGEYEMEVNHGTKCVSYTRLSPFRRHMEIRKSADNILPLMNPGEEDFQFIGLNSTREPQLQLWQRISEATRPDLSSTMTTLWFAPSTGDLICWEYCTRNKDTNRQWTIPNVVDVLERNGSPPEGTFSTEPPPGYTLTNSKDSAPMQTMADYSLYSSGPHRVKAYVGFFFPDGSVLLAWSMKKTEEQPPQTSVEGLAAGDPLPDWPVQISGLKQAPDAGAVYTPCHISSTYKDGRIYEWSLYVPDRMLPASSNLEVVFTIDGRESTSIANFPYTSIGGGCLLEIRNPADFNDYVRGAMAELSDTANPSANLNYQTIANLAQQLRPTEHQ